MADALGTPASRHEPADLRLARIPGRHLNPSVLAFTVLVCLLTAVLSAIVPAIYSSRIPVNETLKEGGRGGMSARARTAPAPCWWSAEVALAAVALIGAGLFQRSFQNARAVDPGFDTHNVLVARLYLSSSGYSSTRSCAFDRALRLRLEQCSRHPTGEPMPIGCRCGSAIRPGTACWWKATRAARRIDSGCSAPWWRPAISTLMRIPAALGPRFQANGMTRIRRP